MRDNPIPSDGGWDDVSGETFLRTMLALPIGPAKFETGRDPMYDCVVASGVNPRSMAQRIMDVRLVWVNGLVRLFSFSFAGRGCVGLLDGLGRPPRRRRTRCTQPARPSLSSRPPIRSGHSWPRSGRRT